MFQTKKKMNTFLAYKVVDQSHSPFAQVIVNLTLKAITNNK